MRPVPPRVSNNNNNTNINANINHNVHQITAMYPPPSGSNVITCMGSPVSASITAPGIHNHNHNFNAISSGVCHHHTNPMYPAAAPAHLHTNPNNPNQNDDHQFQISKWRKQWKLLRNRKKELCTEIHGRRESDEDGDGVGDYDYDYDGGGNGNGNGNVNGAPSRSFHRRQQLGCAGSLCSFFLSTKKQMTYKTNKALDRLFLIDSFLCQNYNDDDGEHEDDTDDDDDERYSRIQRYHRHRRRLKKLRRRKRKKRVRKGSRSSRSGNRTQSRKKRNRKKKKKRPKYLSIETTSIEMLKNHELRTVLRRVISDYFQSERVFFEDSDMPELLADEHFQLEMQQLEREASAVAPQTSQQTVTSSEDGDGGGGGVRVEQKEDADEEEEEEQQQHQQPQKAKQQLNELAINAKSMGGDVLRFHPSATTSPSAQSLQLQKQKMEAEELNRRISTAMKKDPRVLQKQPLYRAHFEAQLMETVKQFKIDGASFNTLASDAILLMFGSGFNRKSKVMKKVIGDIYQNTVDFDCYKLHPPFDIFSFITAIGSPEATRKTRRGRGVPLPLATPSASATETPIATKWNNNNGTSGTVTSTYDMISYLNDYIHLTQHHQYNHRLCTYWVLKNGTECDIVKGTKRDLIIDDTQPKSVAALKFVETAHKILFHNMIDEEPDGHQTHNASHGDGNDDSDSSQSDVDSDDDRYHYFQKKNNKKNKKNVVIDDNENDNNGNNGNNNNWSGAVTAEVTHLNRENNNNSNNDGAKNGAAPKNWYYEIKLQGIDIDSEDLCSPYDTLEDELLNNKFIMSDNNTSNSNNPFAEGQLTLAEWRYCQQLSQWYKQTDVRRRDYGSMTLKQLQSLIVYCYTETAGKLVRETLHKSTGELTEIAFWYKSLFLCVNRQGQQLSTNYKSLYRGLDWHYVCVGCLTFDFCVTVDLCVSVFCIFSIFLFVCRSLAIINLSLIARLLALHR